MGNIIAGCNTPWKAEALATADSTAYKTWRTASATTVLTSAADIQLVDPNKFSAAVGTTTGTPNFLLQATSPAAAGAVSVSAYGLSNTTYRGAFDGATDWTKGWTTWAAESTAY
jgi:DNA polymerase/3'-5' exonuclease PolX